MRKKSEPVVTTELCHYGCGNVALFRNNSGKLMCCASANSCPANRKKNSDKCKVVYKSGCRDQKALYNALSQETKDRMNWNKGNCNADFTYNGKGNHKQVLIRERGYTCECCGGEVWLDKAIPLELDHIDGDNKNNVKENLKLLCPNCHAMTPTYRGRGINTGVKKVSDEILINTLKTSKNIRQALLKVGLVAKAGNYDRCKRLLNTAGLAKLVDAPGLSPDDL